jgi:phosphonatase-like hydrolase
MIDLAALDIAGTTVDDHGAVYEVLLEVTRAANPDLGADDITPWMGTDKREAIAALVGPERRAEVDVDTLYLQFVARLGERYAEQPPTPLPGVPEALATLRDRGVKVALTTGFGQEITGPLLAAIGWEVGGLLDAVVCADEVPAGRPAPYLIFRAMERTGVRRVDRVLVAGDTAADLAAGDNAGAAAVVGVATGGYSLTDLAAWPHTHLLAGVADIPDLLTRLAL